MKIKKLVSLILAAVLLLGFAFAEVQYITNIQVSARPLDGSAPAPTLTPEPTEAPTPEPTAEPTPEPTEAPTAEPTAAPTEVPTAEPTAEPTPEPTPEPYTGTYEIEVDLNNQIVTVYRTGGRSTADIARQMICSSGTDDNTPLGTYIMPEVMKVDEREEWYYIGQYRLFVQYASRIVDSILFHSLPSEKKGISPTRDSREALGTRASHGCIRLRPEDSRWIAQNCLPGTRVNIFEDGFADEELRRKLLRTSYVPEEMSYDEFLAGELVLSVSSDVPEVAEVQAQLALMGYAAGEADGIFGAETRTAVMKWQEDSGFEATGVLNPVQMKRLMALRPTLDPNATPAPETTPEPTAATQAPGRPGIVKVDTALIVRSEPKAGSTKVGSLQSGAEVQVLEQTMGFYKIQAGELTGYVGENYIKIVD